METAGNLNSYLDSKKVRENSNDKRQQAKDRKTEYFLGNWKILHISSEIIGPLEEFMIKSSWLLDDFC